MLPIGCRCLNRRKNEMNGFDLQDYESRELKRWLAFAHPDVEHKLLEHFNIQGIDQLRTGQFDEAVDFIQDMHVKLTIKRKK